MEEEKKNPFFKYISHKNWVKENEAFLFDGMRKLIMYDSKKAEAFNAFFNLTKKVNSDLEMRRTANIWERRAKSQVESEKELGRTHSHGGLQSLPLAAQDSQGVGSSSLD